MKKGLAKTLADKLLTVFFPEKCIFCGMMPVKVPLDHGVCNECSNKIRYLSNPDISGIADNIDDAPDKIYCSCRYAGNIKKAIVSLKYGGKNYIAEPLSWLLYKGVRSQVDFSQYDFICAVPSSGARIRERGYNQAELLARGLAEFSGLTYIKDVLLKTGDLTSQSLLNMEERLSSVRGIYCLNGMNLSGKKIILIDDVLTTGATIIECAKMLRDGGADRVAAVILATGKRNV